MNEIVIRDVPIRFPFKPYKVQEDYMSKVLECLQQRVNGVLESPTGTGKTLSLLCASLAWLEVKKAQLQANAQGLLLNSAAQEVFGNSLREKLQKSAGSVESPVESWSKMLSLPTIIYASRTHAQLTQVMKELKRSNYGHVKSTILGSRDQLCLHPDLAEERGFMKVTLCRAKVKAKACHYHNNLESKRHAKEGSGLPAEVMDIEDLVKFGHRAQCCPYFTAREMMDKADIVFMPYNYLLDPQTRRSQRITLENCVVLLDEGHNVEKTCEEAASVHITSTEIALCIMDVTQAMKKFADNEKLAEGGEDVGQDFTMEELIMLKTMFLALETAVDEILLDKTGGKTFPGSYIFEILAKAEIVMSKVPILDEYLTKLAQFLSTTSDSPLAQKGGNLLRFLEFLKVVNESCVSGEKQNTDLYYKVHVEPEQPKRSKPDSWASTKNTVNPKAKVINFWCFSPGFAMRSLVKQNVHCVILTSGTLSPLQATVSELGIPVPVQLENPHIINDNQICVMTLDKGPTGEKLISTYNNRENPSYLSDLGRAITNFCRVTPDGILVFFASFPVMEKTINFWQQEGFWSQINALKPLFVEPTRRESLEEVLREYHRTLAAEGSRGAVLLAVLRGKVSEGIDFADAHARAVIVTGIPYPPLKDPRVILKQEYVDVARKTNPTGLSGRQWYELDAVRAVNQAVGRVIRHANDFGAVLLCDCRYANPTVQNTLSLWLRSHLVKCQNFGPAYGKITKFFRTMGVSPLTKSVQPGASFDMSESKVRSKESTMADSQAKKQTESQASMREFLQKVCSTGTKASPSVKPKSLLDALDTSHQDGPQKILDIKKVVFDGPAGRVEPMVVPAPKRRKLRVEPVRFSKSSEQDVNQNTPAVSAASSSKTSEERKGSSLEYLQQVKSRLMEDDFQTFKETIKSYAANSVGYEPTVLCLRKVFPDAKTQDLFIGFKRYIKKEHLEKFDQLCRQISSSSSFSS